MQSGSRVTYDFMAKKQIQNNSPLLKYVDKPQYKNVANEDNQRPTITQRPDFQIKQLSKKPMSDIKKRRDEEK